MKTGKRWLALLLALLTAFALCVPSLAASTVVDAVLSDTLAQEQAVLTSPGFGSEWIILGLARSGFIEKGSRYFDGYYTRVVSYVNTAAKNAQALGAPDGALHLVKSTENSRLIVALSALGRDAGSVGAWDLTAPYEDLSWIEAQGLNGPVWALIALDTAGYKTEDSSIRQSCIRYILGHQLSDGGWDVNADSEKADPDMTAMVLQALAGYREQTDVQAAVASGISCLSAIQNDDGSYSSYGAVNSESIAQVIVACTALGIDPHTDSRFVKNGHSAVEALLGFYNAAKRAFHHTMTDENGEATDVNGMATEQAAYAMIAYQRLLAQKTSLYDMSDVARDCTDGHSFGEWTEIAASCTEPAVRTRSCTVCGRSEFEETAPALGHKSGSGYEMSDEAHWIPCALCGAHLKEAEHKYTGDQCVVCNYHKLGGRIEITPLTALPDALAEVSSLNSLNKLRAEMLSAVQTVDQSIKAADTQLLDVTLMVPSVVENKTVWASADKSVFPADGRITVLLPYPEGTGMNGYEFTVVHAFTSDDFSKETGGMESPAVTKTSSGLQVTTTGLSPVMIGWRTDTGTSTSSSGTVSGRYSGNVRTGDEAQPGLWLCGTLLPMAVMLVRIRRRKHG